MYPLSIVIPELFFIVEVFFLLLLLSFALIFIAFGLLILISSLVELKFIPFIGGILIIYGSISSWVIVAMSLGYINSIFGDFEYPVPYYNKTLLLKTNNNEIVYAITLYSSGRIQLYNENLNYIKGFSVASTDFSIYFINNSSFYVAYTKKEGKLSNVAIDSNGKIKALIMNRNNKINKNNIIYNFHISKPFYLYPFSRGTLSVLTFLLGFFLFFYDARKNNKLK